MAGTIKALDPIDHVLQRSDMYVGPISTNVVEGPTISVVDAGGDITFQLDMDVPRNLGLEQIFQEVLSNAVDRCVMGLSTKVKVGVDPATWTVTVWNDGEGVPSTPAEGTDRPAAEVAFCRFYTGSNFESTSAAGRNGIGVKAANIFSTSFVVDTVAGGKRFQQTHSKNMQERTTPKVTGAAKKAPYTQVKMTIDAARFGFDPDAPIPEAVLSQFYMRVVWASCALASLPKPPALWLNGKKMPFKSTMDVLRALCGGVPKTLTVTSTPLASPGKVTAIAAFVDSPLAGMHFGVVNGIPCHHGVLERHAHAALLDACKKAMPKSVAGRMVPSFIKQRAVLLSVGSVEDPSFDSQTKTNMTGPAVGVCRAQWGGGLQFDAKTVKPVLKRAGVVDALVAAVKGAEDAAAIRDAAKDQKAATDKVAGRLVVRVPKLDDAINAGRKNTKAVLYITEGDSAKGLATSMTSVLGRKDVGIFPLRGKPLNPRNKSLSAAMSNKEISYLFTALGLQPGVDYRVSSNRAKLRYAALEILADADDDGVHIRASVLNILHALTPTLLEADPTFVRYFITPITRATKKRKQRRDDSSSMVEHFTKQEYEAWEEEQGGPEAVAKGWSVSHLKGLGTSSAEDARRYAKKRKEVHSRPLKYSGDGDKEALLDFFDKERTGVRKAMLGADVYDKDVHIPYDAKPAQETISFEDMLRKELVHFSHADVMRSIPAVTDGMKESQRKVLYVMLAKRITTPTKVAQLKARIALDTHYAHGEVSLPVVAMAKTHHGTNNVSVFVKGGNFGSRLGLDTNAADRYIFTSLNTTLADALYPPADYATLSHRMEEGHVVEWNRASPVLPVVLLNRQEGIGSGYSCTLHPVHPDALAAAVQGWIETREDRESRAAWYTATNAELKPWYRGFEGQMTDGAVDEATGRVTKYTVMGVASLEGTTVTISELPPRTWLEAYLDKMKDKAWVRDVHNYSSDTVVSVKLIVTADWASKWKDAGKEVFLKEVGLVDTLHMTNMTLLDDKDHVKKFDTYADIVDAACQPRWAQYHTRKQWLIQQHKAAAQMAQAKLRFVQAVVAGELDVMHRKEVEVAEELAEGDYPMLSGDDGDRPVARFAYLLKIPIAQFTTDHMEMWSNRAEEEEKKLAMVEASQLDETWKAEIEAVVNELQKL